MAESIQRRFPLFRRPAPNGGDVAHEPEELRGCLVSGEISPYYDGKTPGSAGVAVEV